MKQTTPFARSGRRLLAFAAFAATTFGLHGQSGTSAEEASEPEAIVLSAFQVSTARDVGYFSAETTAGTRTSKTLAELPGTVSIINEAMIDDLKIDRLSDALNYGTAGVTSLDIIRDDFNIRGFREANTFRDGVVQLGFFNNQVYDLERIEVLKGPVALSFGSGTILGGAVNMISKAPSATPVREIDVSFGPNNFVRSTVNVSDALTDDKSVRYRVTAGAQNDDRWKEMEFDNNIFFGSGVDFDFGNTTVSLYGYHFDTEGYLYFNDFLDSQTPTGILQFNENSTEDFSTARQKDVFANNTDNYFKASLATQLNDDLSFRVLYRYQDLKDRRRIIRGISLEADGFTLNRQDIPFATDGSTSTVQADLNYVLNFNGMKHDITAGVDYTNGLFRQGLIVLPVSPLDTRNPDFSSDDSLPQGDDIPAFTSDNVTYTDTTSYYISDYISFFEGKLSLAGGIRWVDDVVAQKNRITNVVTREATPTQSAPNYGVVYQPTANSSVYAVHSETVASSNGLDQRGELLADSVGEMDEIGIKAFGINLLGGQVFSSVAYFDMAKTNVRVILPDIDPETGFSIITTTAGDTSKGFEFEFGYRAEVGPGQVDLIATHYNAETRNTAGLRVPFAPDNVTSLLVKYSWNQGPLDGLAFGLGSYNEGTKLGTTAQDRILDYGSTYDAFANYSWNNWDFSLNVYNMSDNRYVYRIATPGLVSGNEPRTFRLNIGYRW